MRVCCLSAKYRLPGTYRAAIHPVGNSELFRIVREARKFEAQFTLCKELNYEPFLVPQEGEPRSLAKVWSSRKVSFGNSASFQRSD